MRIIEEEAEVGVVEGAIIPGGEEEVTIDEIQLMSEIRQEYSRSYPRPINHTVPQPRQDWDRTFHPLEKTDDRLHSQSLKLSARRDFSRHND